MTTRLRTTVLKVENNFLMNYEKNEGCPRGELQQTDAEHDQPLDPQPGRGRHPLHRLLRPLLRGSLRPPPQLALR